MGILIVVVMFQVNYWMALGKNNMIANVPKDAVLKIIFLETPGFFNMTLPISVSLAISLTMSRISRESELTAMKGAGIRVLRILRPVMLFGLLVGVLNFWIVDRVTPLASRKSKELQTKVNLIASLGDLGTGVSLRIQNYCVYIGMVEKDKKDPNRARLTDIMLIERPEPGQMTVILSKLGDFDQGVWRLYNAKTFLYRTDSKDVTVSESKEFLINYRVVLQDLLMAPGAAEMGVRELDLKIKEFKRLGQDTRIMEIEFHSKLSAALMCLIFSIVSPIFSIRLAKQGGFIGILISVGIVLAYLNLWVVFTQIIGKNPSVNPAIAAWSPNALFIVVGLIGLRSLE
jgi:lipopolysaccharide export LptBFGC system permease protein LptF